MSYWLGIDFGTTFTAAAVIRDGEQTVDLVPLGDNGTSIASVVFVAPDGSLVVGDAAVRRAVTDPDRVVREVKRRIGDQTPVLVAGRPIGAHTLAARFVRWVVDRVTEREGEWPAGIGVTYPASWGPHKRTLLADALVFAGIEGVMLVTEPEAAAVAYTASRHVDPGAAIGVYDLGGGTFDATIVRQLDGGLFELAGRPEGIDSLGGIDFDEAVFEQVRAHLGAAWAGLDLTDPMVMTAAATLRRECTEAKKALSSDTEVTIPVMLPGVSTHVRMVRGEFEQLIAPAIDATVDALRRAMRSAGMRPDDLAAVLLVGGSSRIPLVAQRVSADLDLPVTVDSDPKAVVAIGAALAVAPREAEATTTVRTAVPVPLDEAPAPRGRRRKLAYAVVGLATCAAALVGLAGIVGTEVLPGGDAPTGEGLAAPAVDGEGTDGAATTDGGDDPWTGKPYTDTTAPGPTRPDAEPAAETPTELTPAPTPGKNRAALVDGAKPSQANPATGAGGTGTGGPPPAGDETSNDPPPPVAESSSDEPPPAGETSSSEEPPPPPAESSSEPPPDPDPAGDPTTGESTTGSTTEGA